MEKKKRDFFKGYLSFFFLFLPFSHLSWAYLLLPEKQFLANPAGMVVKQEYLVNDSSNKKIKGGQVIRNCW